MRGGRRSPGHRGCGRARHPSGHISPRSSAGSASPTCGRPPPRCRCHARRRTPRRLAPRRCSSRSSRRTARPGSSSRSGPRRCRRTRARSPSRAGSSRRASTPTSGPPRCGRPTRRSASIRALVEIVGELDSLTTVMGRFLLTPFVGLLPQRPVLVPHVTEVVSVFDHAISELLDAEAYREERWDLPETLGPEAGIDRAIHFFELPGETVWGATARILVELLEHLTESRPELSGNLDSSSPETEEPPGGSRDRDRQVRAAGLRVRRHRDRPQPAHPRSRGRRHLLGDRRVQVRAAAHRVGDGRRRVARYRDRDRQPRWSRVPQPRRSLDALRRPRARCSRRSPRSRPRRRRGACRRSTTSRSRTS